MKYPQSSRTAIDQMMKFTPEELLRMQGLSGQDAVVMFGSETRVVNRAVYDRITLEREQALDKVRSLEEQCAELRTHKTANLVRAAGWPVATLLTALCTYFLAR